MPLYYFDFRYKEGRAVANHGMWFPDLEAAEREAIDISTQIRIKLGIRRVEVCIRDDHKRIQKEIVDSC